MQYVTFIVKDPHVSPNMKGTRQGIMLKRQVKLIVVVFNTFKSAIIVWCYSIILVQVCFPFNIKENNWVVRCS